MRAQDAVVFANPLSATTASFTINGGKYYFAAVAGTFNSGTVTLQRQSADGLTFYTVTNASFTANGNVVLDLPPGLYQVNLSTTGMVIYAELVRIIEE